MSITKIALSTGLSVSTVSNYLNHPDKVSKSSKAIIKAAMKKHNWRPDICRRGPKSQQRKGVRTGNIVLLSMTRYSPREMARMPFLSMIYSSIQSELNQRQFSMTLIGLEADGNVPARITSQFCDGVILLGRPSAGTHKIYTALKGLPMVWCYRDHSDFLYQMDHILYDNSVVGAIAADYLFRREHRRVAVLNANLQHEAYSERVASFVEASKSQGMTTSVIEYGELKSKYPDVESFRWLTDRLYECGGEEITGAFFCSDDIMLGVYNELRFRNGKEPWLDMIGCNADENMMRFFEKRPASIDIKLDDIGRTTVEQLLRRVNGNSSCCTEIYIKPELRSGD
ncbi:MAG: LacI family DNA-binding transcriptional regulator [Victivallales bacterium]|nr:LacI family DNA-binding transcriptional regulator [Victivallales bacterium]